MANKQIDMRKAKQIFKLYGEGASKRGISKQLGLSRNTATKLDLYPIVHPLKFKQTRFPLIEPVHFIPPLFRLHKTGVGLRLRAV